MILGGAGCAGSALHLGHEALAGAGAGEWLQRRPSPWSWSWVSVARVFGGWLKPKASCPREPKRCVEDFW